MSTTTLELISAEDAFTTTELSDLTTVWQDETPPGKFLRGRHGITHYVIDRTKTSSKKGIVVLGHGLGQSLKMYQLFSDLLVEQGYSCLRYDYFGHGYGKYTDGDMWVKYTPDMFVDQLEDLLTFVREEEKEEEVIAFVGHSNGGVNIISANHRWSKDGEKTYKVIPKMILVNPAIYANKPWVANITDRIPSILTGLMKLVRRTKSLVGKSYMEAAEIAFAQDPTTGEYVYPEAEQKSKATNKRVFGFVKGVKEHPFLAPSILGVSSYNIPAGMLPMHRSRLQNIPKMDVGIKTQFLWGDLDRTVPYKEHVDEIRKFADENDNFSLEILKNNGHECFLEDSAAVAKLVLPFLNAE